MKWKVQDERKNKIRALLTAVAIILSISLIGVFNVENAFAAGEEVYFGSESYEWELYTSNPIGIYAASDNGLEAVEYTVVYDPDMLQYNDDGGDFIEEGKIKFEFTDISGDECKQLLSFTPRVAGGTQIYIRNATITEREGEQINLKDIYVNISLPIPSGCHLDEISVNGKEIPNFDPDTAYYTYSLDEYAEEVKITVEPDTGVEIADTHLQEGRNVVPIFVENVSGQEARYRVIIINPEQPVEEEVAEEVAAEEEESVEEEVMEEEEESFLRKVSRISSNFRVFTRQYTVIIIAVIVVVIVLLSWGIISLRNRRRRRKRTNEWRQRREAKQEERIWERTVRADAENKNRPLAIVVSGITMDFKVERDEPTSIKETVIRTLQRDREVENFRALDNISFTVGDGEVVGIIGTNGSGKSTLLKIISGALIPTKGRVSVDRDKIQLLTLGTGFDYELTGRENVYLNGAIIGYTKEFIDEKYDDIVKFAELEGFMDEKVRNYSSGMVSRLGFAIATIRDTPEILILDEVLSVGDIFFRKKSEARIQEMIHGGSTVLIVSHSMGVIRKNCNKAIWIEKGELRMIGDPNKVCKAYENMENSEAVE